MRRVFLIILCVLLLTTAVHAADTVTQLQSNTTVASDGTCQVSMVIQLSLDNAPEDPRFPLPADARDITLNGHVPKTSSEKLVRWVDLSDVVAAAGSYTLSLTYTLPDAVRALKNGTLELRLELLSGFQYPISQMEFSIQLPGKVEERPVFSSTYHPETIDTMMEYTVVDGVISGHFSQGLKDHETLTMTLEVPEALFPQPIVKQWSLSTEDVIMYGLVLLALVYWLAALRCKPARRLRRTQPPEGITAGELGCCLVGQGVDFNMLVLSWAQMGYLTMQLERGRRVRLHKRMDMGNERSDFEVRMFKTLFGGRRIVDGSGEYYARLGRRAARSLPHARNYYRPSSGNPYVFRILAAGIGICSAFSLAAAFAADTAWRVVLTILLSVLGAAFSWQIQRGARCLHLRHKRDLYLAILCAFLWMVLSNFVGELNVAVLLIVTQFLAGLACAYGGRRTDSGMQSMGEILGLRRYLISVSTRELTEILRHNPDYYFTLAPYAMALGVDKAFSRQFGEEKMTHCPYLTVSGVAPTTARQWNDLLREAISVLDERQKPVLLQKPRHK